MFREYSLAGAVSKLLVSVKTQWQTQTEQKHVKHIKITTLHLY